MWKANKIGIIVLVVGLALLGLAHYLITPYSESLADQVLALGFSLLLFNVAFASWRSGGQPAADSDHADDAIGSDADGEDDAGAD